jgi:hypothetical protein
MSTGPAYFEASLPAPVCARTFEGEGSRGESLHTCYYVLKSFTGRVTTEAGVAACERTDCYPAVGRVNCLAPMSEHRACDSAFRL